MSRVPLRQGQASAGGGLAQEREPRPARLTKRTRRSHAPTDTVATWNPWPINSLAASAIELLDGLVEVPEASWASSRRRLSDTVAVMDYDSWDHKNPHRRTLIWSREEAGHRQVQAVLNGWRNAN